MPFVATFKVFTVANMPTSCLSNRLNLGWNDMYVFEIYAIWKPVPGIICFLSCMVLQVFVFLAHWSSRGGCSPQGRRLDSQWRRDLPLNKVSLQVYPSSNIDVTQKGSGTGQNSASVKKGWKFSFHTIYHPKLCAESLQWNKANSKMQKGTQIRCHHLVSDPQIRL